MAMAEDMSKTIPSLTEIARSASQEYEGLLNQELAKIDAEEREEKFKKQALERKTKGVFTSGHPSDHVLTGIRRKDKSEEWLITYLDTITLLFALFVLLLSISTITPQKFAEVVDGLQAVKQNPGLLTGGETIFEIPLPVQNKDDEEPSTEENALVALQEKINEHNLGQDVEVKLTDNLLDLQLKDNVLFSSGETELLTGGIEVLRKLLPIFQEGDFKISIEGNTDNIPISTPLFPSNWELSGARAASVARGLIELGVSEKRLQIVGHAHTKPLAENDTLEGRKKNRRVNIILQINAEQANMFLK